MGTGAAGDAVWAAVAAAEVLQPEHSHALYQLVYYSAYAEWDRAAQGPRRTGSQSVRRSYPL